MKGSWAVHRILPEPEKQVGARLPETGPRIMLPSLSGKISGIVCDIAASILAGEQSTLWVCSLLWLPGSGNPRSDFSTPPLRKAVNMIVFHFFLL